MKRNTSKSDAVEVGEVVSFKVLDQPFADLVNSALAATNTSKSDLAREAFRTGLRAVVWKMSEGREKALKEFQRLDADASSDPASRLSGFVKLAEDSAAEKRKKRG